MPLPVRTLSSTPYSAPQPGNQNAGGGLFGGPNINPNLGFGSMTYTPPPTLANPAGGGTAGMTLPNPTNPWGSAPAVMTPELFQKLYGGGGAANPAGGTASAAQPTGNMGWRNFTFQNPTSPFQQNFNSLAAQNPDAAFSYAFGSRGSPGSAQNSNDLINAMNAQFGGGMGQAALGAYNPGSFEPNSAMSQSLGLPSTWHGAPGVGTFDPTGKAFSFGGQTYNLANQVNTGATPNSWTLGGVANGQTPNFGGDMAQGGQGGPSQSNQPGNQGGAPGFSQSPGNFTGGMTPQDYINPAAAWARGEGLKGVQGTYAGSPYGLNSGAAMKGIGDYLTGSSLNQAWQPGFQNYMQDKGFNYGVATGDRNFQYQAQLNDQTIPFQQQMQMANLGINGAYGGGDIASKLAAIISQNALGAGQVGANGTIGGNNAITGALQQIIQNGMQMGGPQGQFWQQLIAQMNGMPQGH